MDKNYYVYSGAWGFKSEPRGVRGYSYDPEQNRLAPLGTWGEQVSQAILAVRDDLVFAVSERRDGGNVVSYRIQPDGSLKELCQIPLDAHMLSYISLDPIGPYAFVSSMGVATVTVLRYDENGQLTITDIKKLMGHSVTPRQTNPCVHCVFPSPTGELVAAMNLGADEVVVYKLDRESGVLELVQHFIVDPGRGPRHMAFHPSGRFAYCVTEMGNRVYAFGVENGRLHEIATYPTLSRAGVQSGWAADIVVSADGSSLYATNRDQNNIAAWRIHPELGSLELIGHFPSGGEGPRGICVGADDRVMFVANHGNGTLAVLARDAHTGALGEVLQTFAAPDVSCVRWTHL